MDPTTALLVDVLAILVLLSNIFIVGFLVWTVVARQTLPTQITAFFRKYGLWGAFILALTGTLITLYFSEIVGLVPCKLCWFARIALYPQVVLLGLALLRKERIIADYCIGLSIAGIFFSLWHYLLQMTGSSAFSCGAGETESCAIRYFFEFNYITFPMMGLTLFALIIILLVYAREYKEPRSFWRSMRAFFSK